MGSGPRVRLGRRRRHRRLLRRDVLRRLPSGLRSLGQLRRPTGGQRLLTSSHAESGPAARSPPAPPIRMGARDSIRNPQLRVADCSALGRVGRLEQVFARGTRLGGFIDAVRDANAKT